MAKRDYYEVLGVSKSDDEKAINKAYKRLAMKFHPDRNPGDKEAEAGAVAVRSRKEGDKGAMPVAAFIDMLTDEVQKKTL